MSAPGTGTLQGGLIAALASLLALAGLPGAAAAPTLHPMTSGPVIEVVNAPAQLGGSTGEACRSLKVKLSGDVTDVLAVYLTTKADSQFGALTYFDKNGGITPGTYTFNRGNDWCRQVGFTPQASSPITKKMYVVAESYSNDVIGSTAFTVTYRPPSVRWTRASAPVRSEIVRQFNAEEGKFGEEPRAASCFLVQTLTGTSSFARLSFARRALPVSCRQSDGFGWALYWRNGSGWQRAGISGTGGPSSERCQFEPGVPVSIVSRFTTFGC